MEKHPIQQFIVHTLVKQALVFEEQSIEYYRRAAERITDEVSRKILLDLADEEEKHKQHLEQFLSGNFHEIFEVHLSQEKLHLTIDSHYLHQQVDATWTEQEILTLAITREKASYNFYLLLAQKTKIHAAKQVFLYLAQAEKEHLHRLEQNQQTKPR